MSIFRDLRALLGAAIAIALVFGAACGGSGGDGSTSAPREAISAADANDGGAGAPDAPSEGERYQADGDVEGAGFDNGALPALLDRKIIRTATLSLDVDAVSQKFEDISNIALGAGGFVSSSTFGNRGASQTASVTIRIPADVYDETLRRLRGLGDVREESSNANDVTEQFTDLESRLRNLQASEERYLEFLTRAADITEVLAVQDRLNATRAEIEQEQGRIQLLDNQAALATITVHLLPPAAAADDGGADNPLQVAKEAFESSLAVLLGIATVAIAVAAFSWWLVPLAVGGWYLGRKQVRAMREG
jgi:hypothetical protein